MAREKFEKTKPYISPLVSVMADIEGFGIGRQIFMELYRQNQDVIENMTLDEREEVFMGILLGREDLTKELLERLCNAYETSLEEVLNGTVRD